MMNKRNIRLTVAFLSALMLLVGCGKDGDGKLEMKEPRKELSEMPQRKGWFDTPISQQPTDEPKK